MNKCEVYFISMSLHNEKLTEFFILFLGSFYRYLQQFDSQNDIHA